MIVIAYKNGDPADVLMMSTEKCKEYWELWLARLEEYQLRFPDVEPRDQAGFPDNIACEKSEAKEAIFETLRPRAVHSIGTPLKNLGNVLRDEDFVRERSIWEQIKCLFYSLANAKFVANWKVFFMEFFKKERK